MGYSNVVLCGANTGFVEYVPDGTLGTGNYVAFRLNIGGVVKTAYLIFGEGEPGELVAPNGSLYWDFSTGDLYLRNTGAWQKVAFVQP